METQLPTLAAQHIEKALGLEAKAEANPILAATNFTVDGLISVHIGKNRLPVAILSDQTVPLKSFLRNFASKIPWTTLIVGNDLSATTRHKLKKHRVGYIDLQSGEAYLPIELHGEMEYKRDSRTHSHNSSVFHLSPQFPSSVLKPESSQKNIPVHFDSEGVLRVILTLLSSRKARESTQNKIAELSDVSPGTVNRCLKLLKASGHISKKGRPYALAQVGELLEKWALAYNDSLRPSLILGTYQTTALDLEPLGLQSPTAPFPGEAYEGGENAASTILKNYRGKTRVFYTSEDEIPKLIQHYRWRATPEGNITLLRRFWDPRICPKENDTAPLAIIYADLLALRDDRAKEAAQKISSRLQWKDE